MFIKQIIEIFGIKRVVAIGKKAEKSLNRLNIDCGKVRHSSFDGKIEFVQGIKDIF